MANRVWEQVGTLADVRAGFNPEASECGRNDRIDAELDRMQLVLEALRSQLAAQMQTLTTELASQMQTLTTELAALRVELLEN